MLLRQYTRGKNGAIFLPYTLIFLTLQRWQTFFNCANFLQIFFDFFVKMPFGVFRCGGGGFLCISRTSLGLRYTDGGGNPRPNVARLIVKVAAGGGCGSDGGGTAYFWAHFWAFSRGVWNCPPFRRLPLKRRIFGRFRGCFPVLLQIPVQKNTGGNGGNHTGGDVGGILARVGGNREGLIFVVQVSKHTNAQLKGVLCVF